MLKTNGHENTVVKAASGREDQYMIEALVQKKGSKYLVKWQNYPKDQSTWEPKSSIPEDIIKEFEKDLMTKKVSTKEKITKKGNILNKELTSSTNTPTTKIKTQLKIEENSCKKSKRKLKQTLLDLKSNTKAVKIPKSTNKRIMNYQNLRH